MEFESPAATWLCVLSQYVPEINVGNINQCVVCGGVTGSNWPGGSSILPYCCWGMVGGMGSNPIRTFRRTAIFGNLFLSLKLSKVACMEYMAVRVSHTQSGAC